MVVEICCYSRAGMGESIPSNMLHANRLGWVAVEITNEPLQSDFFPEGTGLIYVTVTGNENCRIALGTDPVAVNFGNSRSQLLLAGREYSFLIPFARFRASVVNNGS